MPSLALYTGSFDPPVLHHRMVAARLSELFDEVLVIPGGPRPGKISSSPGIHRATMADLNFRGLNKVRVDLTDLERETFSPHHEVAARFRAEGREVSHVVAAEFVRGGGRGESFIQRTWAEGPRLWNESHFTILQERDEPLEAADCPPRHRTLIVDPYLPSDSVRLMLSQGEPAEIHLHPPVASYIQRRELYTDVPTPNHTTYRLSEPKIRLFVDALNPRSRAVASSLKHLENGEPQAIVAIGGDGTMLRAIRSHWRERTPFFGINAGGQGFLLNGREPDRFWERDLLLYQLPLLWVEVEFLDGEKKESLAFNDAWVERATGQTAWVRVLVNGVERVAKLVGDGVLVATAAGSSSYARAMGATPVPLGTDVLVLAGSNVLKPAFWRPAVLPSDSVIELETIDPERRPLRAFIDGVEGSKLIRRMMVRVSRTAAAEIAFLPDHDPVAKLALLQFPRGDGE